MNHLYLVEVFVSDLESGEEEPRPIAKLSGSTGGEFPYIELSGVVSDAAKAIEKDYANQKEQNHVE